MAGQTLDPDCLGSSPGYVSSRTLDKLFTLSGFDFFFCMITACATKGCCEDPFIHLASASAQSPWGGDYVIFKHISPASDANLLPSHSECQYLDKCPGWSRKDL